MHTANDLTIRWRKTSDNSTIIKIDQHCYLNALQYSELIKLLREPSVIAIVAEERGHVLGYAIYRLSGFAIEIIRIGVDPRERRNGVGTALIDRLKSKLKGQRRDTITIDTPGVSLAAQLFLSKAGFMAESRPGDVIRFTFDLETSE